MSEWRLYLTGLLLIESIIVWSVTRLTIYEKCYNERVIEQLRSDLFFFWGGGVLLSAVENCYYRHISTIPNFVSLSLYSTNFLLAKRFVPALPNSFPQFCLSQIYIILTQGWIQVLLGPEAYKIFVAVFVKKDTKKYEFKIRYESECLFWAPPRALEEARASEGPWSLSFFSVTVNPPPPPAFNTTNESW